MCLGVVDLGPGGAGHLPYGSNMGDEVVIVGAGPAGLAAGAALRRHGLRPTLLERSEAVGDSWRERYDSLRLHTVRSLSDLPGLPMPRRYGRWVARDDVADYLQGYARHFDLRPRLGVTVRRIEPRSSTGSGSPGWRVVTSKGELDADAVVMATGYSHTPRIPDWPGRSDFRPMVVHSAHYRTPYDYVGRRVLVVGAGNSATDIATELAGVAAEVMVSVRTPPNIVRRSSLGVPTQLVGLAMKRVPEPVMNPMSDLLRRVSVPDLAEYGLPAPKGGFSQFLRTRTVPVIDHGFVDKVRSRQISVVPAVEALDVDQVRLADGRTVRPDAVVAATGYTTGLTDLVGHLGVLDDYGLPLARGADSVPHAPGLHFVGITVELSGLLHEIGLEARAVGRAVGRALAKEARPAA